jgi:hypothetical protein
LNYEPNAGISAHRTLGTHEQQSIWEISVKSADVRGIDEERAPKRRPLGLLLLILGLGAVGMFIVPWHVPVRPALVTASYLYGFNNRVSQLTLAGVLAAVFVLQFLQSRREGRLDRMSTAVADTLAVEDARQGDRRLAVSFLGASLAVILALTAWYCWVPVTRYGEMAYFLSRIDMLVLHRAAYYQFPFMYGPGMIYPPYWLYLLAGGRLSVEQSYFIVFLAHWVLAFGLLAFCVRALFPPSYRVGVFVGFVCTFINFTLGMNYAPLRFIVPLAGLLWMHLIVAKGGSRALAVSAAFLGPFASFLISPEMGAASAASTVVYGCWLVFGKRIEGLWIAVFGVAGSVAVLLPWSNHYFGDLFGYGGAFPLFPGLTILLLVGAALLVLPSMGVVALKGMGPTSASAAACAVQFGLLLVPSLWRADSGHVYLNSLGLFIAAIAVTARMGGKWFSRSFIALLLVFGLLGSWLFLFGLPYYYKITKEARAQMGNARHDDAGTLPGSEFHFSKPAPPRTGMAPLLAFGPMAVPLDSDEAIDRYLKLTGHYLVGYFTPYEPDVYTPAQLALQLDEICSFPTILVPKAVIDQPQAAFAPTQAATDSRFLTKTQMFPVRLHPRNLYFSPLPYLVAGIKARFTPVGSFGDYYVMKPKPEGQD